jgi:hypothetical protein
LSIEIQTGFPCPHLIMEEVVSLGSDRRSLKTKGPIANAGSVRVLVNNQLYVPPGGLHTPADLLSGVGPFNISKCDGFRGPEANLLSVTSSGGTVAVALPEGPRLSAEQVARSLRLSALSSIVAVVPSGGALLFRDIQNVGVASLVRVSGDGASLLGFGQRGSRGRELYPAWTLASEPSVLPNPGPRGQYPGPWRYPQFVSDVRLNPMIKVTYVATPDRCPRCRATYVENDYRFDKDGAMVTIANADLLYQACLKSILTRRGSNPYHTAYGSRVMNRIGSKRAGATAADLEQDVMEALKQVLSVQRKQARFQQVTDSERLYQISSVNIRPSPTDPTTFQIAVVVRNGSNRPVSLNIVYSAPGAVALAGSNGLSLGVPSTGLGG